MIYSGVATRFWPLKGGCGNEAAGVWTSVNDGRRRGPLQRHATTDTRSRATRDLGAEKENKLRRLRANLSLNNVRWHALAKQNAEVPSRDAMATAPMQRSGVKSTANVRGASCVAILVWCAMLNASSKCGYHDEASTLRCEEGSRLLLPETEVSIPEGGLTEVGNINARRC